MTAVIAIAAGVILAFAALAANVPKLVAIILTAFAGASWLAAGIALVPGIIKTDGVSRRSGY